MDDLDNRLKEFFTPAASRDMTDRMARRIRAEDAGLEELADRFHFEATDRGIARLTFGRGRDVATEVGRRHLERARAELAEYLAGRRTFFTVAVDLDVPVFQGQVLTEAARIPFGEVESYRTLAERIGRPRAARAVGNALGANPIPIIVPCHRIIRGDGTWGHYAFGGELKTRLLTLERSTPVLIGCTTTRIVCRRGCAHEQRMGDDRRVVFASVADARSVGYRPCRACRPALGDPR